MVWLPQAQVVFAGDIVYVDRLLAVLPVSSTREWLDAFAALEQLAPKRIVPGHGRLTDLATARAQTQAYLEALRAHMKRAVEQGIDMSDAVKSFNAAPFLHLSSTADLSPGNASRTYLEVERESARGTPVRARPRQTESLGQTAPPRGFAPWLNDERRVQRSYLSTTSGTR